MSELIFKNGCFFNEFGSIVYPRKKDQQKYWDSHPNEKISVSQTVRTSCVNSKDYKQVSVPFNFNNRKFQEFEIHAVAYDNLRNFFKDDNIVRGEFSIRSNTKGYCYFRCDIAILDESSQPILIIEVKKSRNEVENSSGQIKVYKQFAPVYILDNMKDAENIIQILFEQHFLPIITN